MNYADITPGMASIQEEDIIQGAKNKEPEVKDIIGQNPYEEKGIFNSEALLFITVVELLDVDKIIESGRARGHSTKILSEYFDDKDVEVVSIEKRRGGKDDKIAREKLSGYENLSLRYGDSRELIEEELTKSACVLIDGPKGDEAIKIALSLLKQDNPRAVFIHDLHRNTLHRDLTELLFNNTYFSDSQEYVSDFKHLDDSCWDHLDNKKWGPYLRDGEDIESYASTFGVLFNSDEPIDPLRESNYLKYLSWKQQGEIYRAIGNILQSHQEDGGAVTSRIAGGLHRLGQKIVK